MKMTTFQDKILFRLVLPLETFNLTQMSSKKKLNNNKIQVQ